MKRALMVLIVLLATMAPVRAGTCTICLESDPVPPLVLQEMIRFSERAYAQCEPLTPVYTAGGIECR